jgi:hypothetical protein
MNQMRALVQFGTARLTPGLRAGASSNSSVMVPRVVL